MKLVLSGPPTAVARRTLTIAVPPDEHPAGVPRGPQPRSSRSVCEPCLPAPEDPEDWVLGPAGCWRSPMWSLCAPSHASPATSQSRHARAHAQCTSDGARPGRSTHTMLRGTAREQPVLPSACGALGRGVCRAAQALGQGGGLRTVPDQGGTLSGMCSRCGCTTAGPSRQEEPDVPCLQLEAEK